MQQLGVGDDADVCSACTPYAHHMHTIQQVKRFDEMARKLRFFRDQVCVVRMVVLVLCSCGATTTACTPQCTEAGVPITPRPNMFRKEIEVDELEVGCCWG